MKGTDFIFDFVNFFNYKCYKINLNHGGSYIYSPNSIKKKKRKNPKNSVNDDDDDDDDECFQYAVTVALNYEEIVKYSQRTLQINSNGINYPSGKDD